VRGLSCEVQVKDHKVLIDPGVALGYRRHGLLPHPAQVAVGEQVHRKIVTALQEATDVVLSHFHGDHIPLPDANPYQLNAHQVAPLFRTIRVWSKGPDGLSHHMASRREALIEILGRNLPNAEGQQDDPLRFSLPVIHGDPLTNRGTVMMTRIEDEDCVFVHASDIQLLDGEAVALILAWRPLAQILHMDPRLLVAVIAIASSIDFALVVGTPPTMMAYFTGFFKAKEIFKRGVVLDVIGILFLSLGVIWIWQWLVLCQS